MEVSGEGRDEKQYVRGLAEGIISSNDNVALYLSYHTTSIRTRWGTYPREGSSLLPNPPPVDLVVVIWLALLLVAVHSWAVAALPKQVRVLKMNSESWWT